MYVRCLLILSLLRLAYRFAHAPGQETLAKGAPGRLSSPAKQDATLAEDVSSNHSEPSCAPGGSGTSNQSPGPWVSNSGERAARQVSLRWLIQPLIEKAAAGKLATGIVCVRYFPASASNLSTRYEFMNDNNVFFMSLCLAIIAVVHCVHTCLV